MNLITTNQRQSLVGVHPQFLKRWSPRAFDKKHITHEKQARIFEAARWTPSCYNEQPWKIYTSTPDTFDQFLSLLDTFNQQWAKNAPVIGFLIANTRFKSNGKDNTYSSFDCGAAWMAMTFQALKEDIYMHAMGGIDIKKSESYFKIEENQHVLIGFAMGYQGDKSQLEQPLQEKEQPSSRRNLSDIWTQIK